MDKATIIKGGHLKAAKTHRTAARKPVTAAKRGSTFTRDDMIAAAFEKTGDVDKARLAVNEEINDLAAAGKIEWLGMGRFRKS